MQKQALEINRQDVMVNDSQEDINHQSNGIFVVPGPVLVTLAVAPQQSRPNGA